MGQPDGKRTKRSEVVSIWLDLEISLVSAILFLCGFWSIRGNVCLDGSDGGLFCSCSGGGGVEIDFSSSAGRISEEKECTRKRRRPGSCNKLGTKACREKLRRERLNDRFLDLSTVLEPGRPAKADKPAILDDAIRVLNQLRMEAQELKETNEKLREEIKSVKAEKNELREEKLTLKADKERMEQQLKAMAIPPSGFMPAHPAAYHTGLNKMAVFPGYSLVPMWQYLPPASRDASSDHELAPVA